MQAAFPVTPWSGSDRKLFYGTARVMNLSALRRTRAGRWQRAAGPPLPNLWHGLCNELFRLAADTGRPVGRGRRCDL